MPLLNSLRIVMIVQVLTLLLQATFAGMMIGGNHQAANLHEFTAKILVPLAFFQTVLAIVLRVQARCPLWVPVASAALLAAEIVEFSAGHLHNVAVHVPLGVAIFGGALRQLLWATSGATAPSRVQA
ncbi:MAG TPA: hypothetical protein VGE93_25265 [Bryobacteraceae bacterium]